MALKNCPNCGKIISDKAKVCPKCGTENPFEAEEAQTPIFAAEESEASQATSQVEPTEAVEPADPDVAADVAESVDTEESSDTGVSVDTMESSDTTASSEAIDHAELIDEPERGGHGLKWLIALVVIVLLGGVGYYLYSARESEKELVVIGAKKQADFRASVLRVEEVRREEARLDSIRQDSLFRNFVSNDLLAFDLHGRVSSVKWDAAPVGTLYELDPQTGAYLFDMSGHCREQKPDGEYLSGYDYDKKGRIVSGIFVEDGGCPVLEYKWNDDGKIAETYYSYGMHFNQSTFTYNRDGTLKEVRYLEGANMGFQLIKTSSYEILDTDRWGNWIKRKVTVEGVESYNDIETGETISTNLSHTYTETRTIKYYDI